MRREVRNAASLILALLALSLLTPLVGALFGFGAFLVGSLLYVTLIVYIIFRENRISARRTGVRLRDIRSADVKGPGTLVNIVILVALVVMVLGPMVILSFFYR